MLRMRIRALVIGVIVAIAFVMLLAVKRAGLLAPPPAPSEMRTHLRALLHHPEAPLAPATKPVGEFIEEQGEFHSEAGQTVPFILVKPADAQGKLPAVIVLHGTGGRKEQVTSYCVEVAGHGMLAFAIDARYHGSRIPGRAHRSQEYQDAIIRAWREKNPSQQEHPLYYDTVYDLWRAVDYLGSRSDVDPTRIGTFGFSMGGIEAWLAAGTDERIRVVVIALAAQSFQWNLEHDAWQGRARTLWRAHEAAAKDLGEAEVNAKVCRALWNKVTPGILDEFNCLKMLSAIAPRRLLILNREDDVNAPLEGAKLAFAAAQDAYKKARAEDHLKIDVAPGSDHNTTPEQEKLAYAWLERCLKP